MTLRKDYDSNVGQGIKTRICYNCNKNKRGSLVPDPSDKKSEKKIWCCNDCYKDWYIK